MISEETGDIDRPLFWVQRGRDGPDRGFLGRRRLNHQLLKIGGTSGSVPVVSQISTYVAPIKRLSWALDGFHIKWDKDRGKDVESAPWYHVFDGDRINDHHLTLAEKRAVKN